MNTLFRNNLGLIFDVYHIINCKTISRENWTELFVRSGSETEDLRELDSILDMFGELHPKLALLGFREHKSKSLVGEIALEYADENIGNWTPDGFINYLCNTVRMKQAIAKYYLNTDSCEQIFDSIASNSSISLSCKGLLYEFFLFPDRYLEDVKQEIGRIFSIMKNYQGQKFELLIHCQESFDYALLKQENSPFSKNKKWDSGMKTCYISFSILSKYLIVRSRQAQNGWLVLGYDFFSTLGEVSETPLNIAAFGNAFGDKLRVRIIEELVKNGEMTLADLSKEMNVVNTIAIYHLDILKKENLLLHRNQGRKVLYCLNRRQISKALSAIKSLCGGIDE